MKAIRFATILALSMAFGIAFGQTTPTPPAAPAQPPQAQIVKPNPPYDSRDAKIMVLTEKNLELTAESAQKNYQTQLAQLQSDFKAQEDSLVKWTDEIRKANGWDDTYAYDREHDQWVHTPKKPDDKPKEPAKK